MLDRPGVGAQVPTEVAPAPVAPLLDRTDVTTHMTPDTGIQAYPQAYPPYPATLGPFLPGRRVVQVVAVRGTWAQVFADGADQGWVEGIQLVPPVGAGVRYTAPARGMAPGDTVDHQRSITNGQIVGAVGALGMIIGALVDWTQIVSLNAFRFPVQFLFDNKTHSHGPRLGWFILVLGVLGLAASLVRGAERWRTIVGILGVLIVALFLIQVATGLSSVSIGPFGSHVGFTDIVGGGPWITGIAALMLGISPLFD
jgi:hypothetical protein